MDIDTPEREWRRQNRQRIAELERITRNQKTGLRYFYQHTKDAWRPDTLWNLKMDYQADSGKRLPTEYEGYHG